MTPLTEFTSGPPVLEPRSPPPFVCLPIVGSLLPLRLRGMIGEVPHAVALCWRAQQGGDRLRLEHQDCAPRMTADGVAELDVRLSPRGLPSGEYELDVWLVGAEPAPPPVSLPVKLLDLAALPVADLPPDPLVPRFSVADLPSVGPGTPLPDVAVRFDIHAGATIERAPGAAEDFERMRVAGVNAKRFVHPQSLPAATVAILPDGVAFDGSELVASARGLLDESWNRFALRGPRPGWLAPFQTRRPDTVKGEVLALTSNMRRVSSPKYNHYHFHTEHLAALLQIEAFRKAWPWLDMQVLLPEYGDLQRAAVELLAPELGSVTQAGPGDIQARHLLVPSLAFASHIGPDPLVATVLARLRGNAQAGLLPGGPAPGEVIYVSRLGSPLRPMENEEELVAALLARGARIFDARQLTYHEQVLAFAEAKVIIGPHGAGMVNIGFAPPGAVVVEIFPSTATPPFFARLAALMGHGYRFYIEHVSVVFGKTLPQPTWRLDLPAFLRFLDPIIDDAFGAGRRSSRTGPAAPS